jgi:hypothetical protein
LHLSDFEVVSFIGKQILNGSPIVRLLFRIVDLFSERSSKMEIGV